jgi:tRNA A37 threonylcarbamoyladenosine modification protein TsaB
MSPIANDSFSAALDFSGPEAAFAVSGSGGRVLAESHVRIEGRDSSALLPWIVMTAGQHRIPLKQIGSWVVGSGPGGFTGLRISAALVSGFALGFGNVKTFSMPSPAALFLEMGGDPEKNAVLIDAKNREAALVTLRFQDGKPVFSFKIITAGERPGLPDCAKTGILGNDRAALLKVIPNLETLSSAFWFESYPVRAMLSDAAAVFYNDSVTDPLYLRPAAVAKKH